MEKVFAVLLLVALSVTAGYFWSQRNQATPYRMATQYAAPAENAVPGSAPVASAQSSAGRVDINTATAEELEALPGIGEKRAADIVADREANGPFRHPEDITRVKGIGEGTLAGLIDLITVE